MAPYINEIQIFQSNQKYIENSNDQRTGTGRGCDVTTNPRRTQKPDNPLKGIWNPIPQDLDNPLKIIHDIVQNRTRSQWPIGLTIPT